jgi:hypothetical protein
MHLMHPSTSSNYCTSICVSYQHLLVEFPIIPYVLSFVHLGEQHVKPLHMAYAYCNLE